MATIKPMTVEQAYRLTKTNTPKELAGKLGTSRQTVNYWIGTKQGAIPRWWANFIRGIAK